MEPQYPLNSHSKPEQKYNAEGIIILLQFYRAIAMEKKHENSTKINM